jgi:hypothetical protein
MTSTGGKIQKERLFCVDRSKIAKKLNRSVGQISAQVIVVGFAEWWRHGVIIVKERGNELVGLATMESVPSIKASREGPGRS